MKAVILAGGLGRRLQPLTDPLNKHLLPVYNKPMIAHVISTLVQGGADDFMVLMNGLHPGLFLEMLEDGAQLKCHLTFRQYLSIHGELTLDKTGSAVEIRGDREGKGQICRSGRGVEEWWGRLRRPYGGCKV